MFAIISQGSADCTGPIKLQPRKAYAACVPIGDDRLCAQHVQAECSQHARHDKLLNDILFLIYDYALAILFLTLQVYDFLFSGRRWHWRTLFASSMIHSGECTNNQHERPHKQMPSPWTYRHGEFGMIHHLQRLHPSLQGEPCKGEWPKYVLQRVLPAAIRRQYVVEVALHSDHLRLTESHAYLETPPCIAVHHDVAKGAQGPDDRTWRDSRLPADPVNSACLSQSMREA